MEDNSRAHETQPLSHEQIWGDPEDDWIIEQAMEGEMEDSVSPDYFDANWCPECGEPRQLCSCDILFRRGHNE